MCGIELAAGEARSSQETTPRYDVSGIIGLSDGIKATIVVSVHKELVFQVAENFLGVKPTEIDDDVTDLVGELANMIGGNAKERMTDVSLTLGLPTVVAGENHIVSFGSEMEISALPFESEHGPMVIEVGMVE